jgi:hypothetical protein
MDVAMTHYTDKIEANAFELPGGAKLVDHRER